MNRDENLTVVANRKNISDKEAFARLLLKMYKENSFHSIKFSTDHGYATSLDMTVYSWKEDIEVIIVGYSTPVLPNISPGSSFIFSLRSRTKSAIKTGRDHELTNPGCNIFMNDLCFGAHVA